MRCIKVLAVVFAAMAACMAVAFLPQRLVFEEGVSYTFFCGNTSADCNIITVKRNAALCRLTLKDVCGESTAYLTLDMDNFLRQVNGQIIFIEELTDSVNYYCKADLPYSINLYGTEINLHISLNERGVTVASPIIFGGY